MATGTRWTAAEHKFREGLSSPTDPAATSTVAGPNGTDIAASVDIGSNRSLWLYGDTFWHNTTGETRSTNLRLLRNPVSLQTGRDLSTCTMTWHAGNSNTDAIDFFPPVALEGTIYWKYPLGGVLLDDRVLVVGMTSRQPTASESAFAQFGSVRSGPWATMLLNTGSGTPDTWPQVNVPVGIGNDSFERGPQYTFACNPIDAGDGWVYFHCFGPSRSDRWGVCRMDRQRVKEGDLTDVFWWDSQDGWVRDGPRLRSGQLRKQRHNILTYGQAGGDQTGGVIKRADGQIQHTWVEGGWPEARADTNNNVSADVRYALAANLTTHLTSPSAVYTIPLVHAEDFFYGAYALPEQTWSGKAANSSEQVWVYSDNRTNVNLFNDATTYWPRILKVTGL